MTKNFCTFAVQNPRKDAGVVDRDGLENRCTLTGTQGSNPCLSAKKQPSRLLFLHLERRDENPGRVRYRAALWERSGQRLPVFPQKSSPQGCFFLHPERRDENPGGVRSRVALCEAETPCLSANQLIIKYCKIYTRYYTQKWQ